MFSSPSTTVQNRRSLASAALRGAGLVKGNLDGDISMMEAPGGVKRSSRNKLHERPTRSKRLEKMEQSASAAAKNSSVMIHPLSYHRRTVAGRRDPTLSQPSVMNNPSLHQSLYSASFQFLVNFFSDDDL
jgi:hypothetical protein